MNTVREKIISNLLEGLLDINKTNGYANTVSEVRSGVIEFSQASNFPTVCIEFEREDDETYGESDSLYKSNSDLIVQCLLNAPNNDVKESFIGDLKKYFNSDCGTSSNVCTLIPNVSEIDKYFIKNVYNLVGDNSQVVIRIGFVFDDLISNIELPEVPTLNLPSNGSSEESIYTQFDWNSSISSSRYDVQISTDSGFNETVLFKDNINGTSFTVPFDEQLDNGTTYYWRVRGKNIVGSGEWSSTRSFTPNDTSITPLNPSEISNCILWGRTDTVVTASGGKVTQLTDLTGNGNHLVQTSDTNRPVLVSNVVGTISGIHHNPTGSVRRTIGYNDTTKKFAMISGSSDSFMITFYEDATYSQDNNGICLIGRSNSNVGDNYVLAKYNDNLNNIRGVLQFPLINTNSSIVVVPTSDNLSQVILTYDGTTMRVYKNGTLISKSPRNISNPIVNDVSSYFTIGAEYFNADNGILYKGYIFEVAFWNNKTLTQDEVNSLYKYHQNYYGD